MVLAPEYEDEECRYRFTEETMRKQELVHLHSLLVEITESMVDKDVVSSTVWNDYEGLDIDSYAINSQKDDHEEAVLILATTLSVTLEQPTEEQSSLSVPNQ